MQDKGELAGLMERFRATSADLKKKYVGKSDDMNRSVIKKHISHWRRLARRTREALQQSGEQVAERKGVNRARQAWHVLQIQRQYGLRAEEYYQYRLFEPIKFSHAGLYVSSSQMRPYYHHIKAVISRQTKRKIYDKSAFRIHCQQHGLRSIPTIAVFKNGDVEWGEFGEQLPHTALCVKPLDARKGQGVVLWKCYGGDRYEGRKGKIRTEQEIVADLKRRSHTRAYLLQPRVENHDSLSNLAGQALACIRVITCRGASGGVETMISMLAVAENNSPIANFTEGNGALGMRIFKDGTLGKAFSRDEPLKEPVGKHPVTQESIAGFVIPLWSEVQRLAKAAHETMPELPMVGWDVAIAPEGPLLIEGNLGFGVKSIQMVHQTPLAKIGIPERALSFVEDTN